jgi:hypothetical protein
MKLFKKIAKAAGAAAKKDKAAPPAVADRAEAEKQPAAAEGVAVQAADAPSAKAAGQGLEKEKAQQGAPVRAEEEARLRASYNALSQENEELKQRNRFLLQMLAVSRLDEQKLDDQIQQRQEQLGSPNRSVASSVSSPVHRRV